MGEKGEHEEEVSTLGPVRAWVKITAPDVRSQVAPQYLCLQPCPGMLQSMELERRGTRLPLLMQVCPELPCPSRAPAAPPQHIKLAATKLAP